MKIIEKKCPNCGGNLDFKVGERDVKCANCRRKFAVEYGDTDFSQLTAKAAEALKAADINLRPVRKIMVGMIVGFFIIVAIAVTFSIIAMVNSRNDFNRRAEESRQEFERKSQEMLENVKR